MPAYLKPLKCVEQVVHNALFLLFGCCRQDGRFHKAFKWFRTWSQVSQGCQEQSSLSQRQAAGCRSHRSGLSTHLSLQLKISREIKDLPEEEQEDPTRGKLKSLENRGSLVGRSHDHRYSEQSIKDGIQLSCGGTQQGLVSHHPFK